MKIRAITFAATVFVLACGAAFADGKGGHDQRPGDVGAFLRSMISHHQGAIDMVNVVMANTTDAKLKKRASELLAKEESEVAAMQAELAEYDRTTASKSTGN